MSYAAAFTEGDNVGSVREISLALARKISSINPVTFMPGFGFEDIDFLPESASVKDSSQDTVHGTLYTYVVEFAFNRQNTALYNLFKKYLGINGVVKVTDNNGLTRLIGTPANPVTIRYDADTGEKYSSMNFYKIAVNWSSEKPALVLAA